MLGPARQMSIPNNHTMFTPRDPPRVKFEHDRVREQETDQEAPMSIPQLGLLIRWLDRPQGWGHVGVPDRAQGQDLGSSNQALQHIPELVVHLWQAITQARGQNRFKTTHVRISVNRRVRLIPYMQRVCWKRVLLRLYLVYLND